MKENETGAWALLIAALTVLGKWQMFQTAGEKLLTRWVEGRPWRQMGRRLSDEESARILSHEREELETLVLLLRDAHKADRVTVVEYECPEDGRKLATCIEEDREPRMASIRAQLQRTPLDPSVWAEVQRVHSSPLRCLYVPDVRTLEVPALRSQLIRSGVRTAYYQSLPAVGGHCGGMLSLSWSSSTLLSDEDLAGLHWSGRTLATVLRAIWSYQPTAA